MNLYSIYDRKSATHGMFFTSITDGTATRAVASMLQENDLISRFPEDYDIYFVASIDLESGFVTQDAPPRFVVGIKKLFDYSAVGVESHGTVQ